MATYAIGDVQGCAQTLETLVDRCAFDPDRDRLWFTGDLVNRGPASVQVLEWAYAHREAVTVVLGNHDLHLLARAAGVAAARPLDTLDEVLSSPRRPILLEWLRQRPLMHRQALDTDRGREEFLLLHAGILPGWTVAEAEDRARKAEQKLRGPHHREMLRRLARCRTLSPGRHRRASRAAAATAQVLTNLRACDSRGQPVFGPNGPPDSLPPGLRPWHAFAARRSDGVTFVCGHWAAQGARIDPPLLALDSACVWGGTLTAIRLEDGQLFEVDCCDPIDDPPSSDSDCR